MAKKQTISSRLVLNFPGFEKTTLTHQLGRLQHAAQKSGQVWGFERKPKEPEIDGDEIRAIIESLTKGAIAGKDFKTRTRLVQFSWSDIVQKYENEIFPIGFGLGLPRYFAFFFDGTVWRYFKTSSRYFGFTLFPILLMALFAIAAWLVIYKGLPLTGLVLTGFWAFLAAALLWLALCKFPGDLAYLNLTIADWGFARDMLFRNKRDIEARFADFAGICTTEIKASKADEILIVGHSFGSIWAVVALGMALKQNPELFKGKKIAFLALGSSLLKLALSPKAGFIREHLGRILSEKNLFWHEIQTKDDWIAFYKSDPFAPLGIKASPERYKVDRIRFKTGMENRRYKKMRKSFYTTHRQYILYYDYPTGFDTHLRLFGPYLARDLGDENFVEKLVTDTQKR